jgi:stage V sporulation protein R
MSAALRRAPLFSGADWDFGTIRRIYDAVETIAREDLGLDVYPNQVEIITAEQMLDAYASTGMPVLYKHWSFGKHFAEHEAVYRRGIAPLAYEIVINSNPCISYIMEENTATMQALVMAHAAFGHNHFFKNNYLFKQWTDADGILEYLNFAKGYIAGCEERYGHAAVERLLDSAHALTPQGVHRYPVKSVLDLKSEHRRWTERAIHQERMYNDLWRTVPAKASRSKKAARELEIRSALELPQENVLYFLEKSAPLLKPWQREVIRIVRLIAQYFYPQRQTKVINEGCATYCHYRIMTLMHQRGLLTDGSFLEFLRYHTNVVRQPGFDDPSYSGMNPYALGFAMMQDIERIAAEPTAEDRSVLPTIAGRGDAMPVLREIWANYRDDSFVAQFLSPHLIRKWRLFQIADDPEDSDLRIDAIHDERGYRRLSRALARQYDPARLDPDIQIVEVDLAGDRRLILHHQVLDGAVLQQDNAQNTLQHLAELWGYDVVLQEIQASDGAVLGEYKASPRTAP